MGRYTERIFGCEMKDICPYCLDEREVLTYSKWCDRCGVMWNSSGMTARYDNYTGVETDLRYVSFGCLLVIGEV